MAHMVGADPVQLDALGARMTSAAERLELIRTSIGALLAHSHWDGRDADEFRHLWHHQLAPRLHNAAVVTRAGATTVRVNAQQQCDASGLGGSGSHAYGGSSGAVVDPVKTLIDVKDGFGRLLLTLDGVGWLAGSVSAVALGEIPFLKALVPSLRGLPPGVQNVLVKDLTAMSGFAKGVGVVGELGGAALSGVFLGLNAMELGYRLATDPGAPETYNTGADLLFGIAGVAAIGCPPAALIIGGVGLVYSVATMINPNLTKDIVDGVGGAARAVWEGAGELVEIQRHVAEVSMDAAGELAEAAVDAAEDRIAGAADAAQGVISGGVNAVKHMFSF